MSDEIDRLRAEIADMTKSNEYWKRECLLQIAALKESLDHWKKSWSWRLESIAREELEIAELKAEKDAEIADLKAQIQMILRY